MGSELLESLKAALATSVTVLTGVLPRLLAMVLLAVVGFFAAIVLRAVVRKVLGWIRFDRLLERAGVGETLAKGGVQRPAHLVGTVVCWVGWTAFLLAALGATGFAGAEALATDVVRFVPRLVAAVAVLVVGAFFANLAWRATLLAAVGARMHATRLFGALVRMLVLSASVAIALEVLGLGRGVALAAFAIVFGSVMLAAAIAFGLGGRHIARRYLEDKLFARRESAGEDGPSHL